MNTLKVKRWFATIVFSIYITVILYGAYIYFGMKGTFLALWVIITVSLGLVSLVTLWIGDDKLKINFYIKFAVCSVLAGLVPVMCVLGTSETNKIW